jgi:pimeloyl-ACP methyl ester carboxylesterase
MARAALLLSLSLACLAAAAHVATRVLAARAERRHPPLGAVLRIDGEDVHVVDRGDGPAVVFLHGAFGGLADFLPLAEALAGEARVVLVDRPGHGWSTRPDDDPRTPAAQARWLARVLAELEVERPVLVGFSYGAAVAMAHALERPGEVRAVVTLGGALRDWRGHTSRVFALPDVPLVGPLFVWTFATPFAHFSASDGVAKAFAPEPVPASFERSPLGLALRPRSLRANCAEMRVLQRELAAQELRYRALDVPVLVVAGTEDRVADPNIHSVEASLALPRAELVLLEGAGHQIPYARPDDVLAAIRRALAGEID